MFVMDNGRSHADPAIVIPDVFLIQNTFTHETHSYPFRFFTASISASHT